MSLWRVLNGAKQNRKGMSVSETSTSSETAELHSLGNRPLLAAVVLAYNEAKMLQLTLPRIKACVDQVVIVDMGSTDGSDEVYQALLGDGDHVVLYPQSCLPLFGFANARNYGTRFTDAAFILAIDSDEWIAPDDENVARETARAALSSDEPAFHLPRSNYGNTKGLKLGDIETLIAHAPKSEELHRRLYRNRHDIRWEGLIHEELCDRDGNTWDRSGSCPLRLHHLAEYKELGAKDDKQQLYAYMILRAFTIPGFRFGTNPHWHTTFVIDHTDYLLHQAGRFMAQHDVPKIETGLVREQVAALRSARSQGLLRDGYHPRRT